LFVHDGYFYPESFSRNVFIIAPLTVVSFMILTGSQAVLFSVASIVTSFLCFGFSSFVHESPQFVKLSASSESGAFVGLTFFFTVYFIHQFRMQQESYQRKLDEGLATLQKLNTDNQLLVSLVTHDINNHLFRALGYYEQLQRGEDKDGKRWGYAQSGVNTIMDITHIIQNLVSIRELTEAEVSNSPQAISLGAVIEKAELLHNKRILEKEIKVKKSEAINDIEINTEPLAFSQHLFGNVLSNAIKFAPVESIVTVNVIEDAGHYVIQVINLANQSHVDNLEKVNSKAGQLSSMPGTAGELGQGLGGQIVNQVALKLGVGFELRSDPVDGSLIKVTAELRVAKPKQHIEPSELKSA
jgi:K+-sensing histidine kinase KdpD